MVIDGGRQKMGDREIKEQVLLKTKLDGIGVISYEIRSRKEMHR